jgi:hypothetical protein
VVRLLNGNMPERPNKPTHGDKAARKAYSNKESRRFDKACLLEADRVVARSINKVPVNTGKKLVIWKRSE